MAFNEESKNFVLDQLQGIGEFESKTYIVDWLSYN